MGKLWIGLWILIVFVINAVQQIEAGECCVATLKTFWCSSYCCQQPSTPKSVLLTCCTDVLNRANIQFRESSCFAYFTDNVWPLVLFVGGGIVFLCAVIAGIYYFTCRKNKARTVVRNTITCNTFSTTQPTNVAYQVFPPPYVAEVPPYTE